LPYLSFDTRGIENSILNIGNNLFSQKEYTLAEQM
jgi:hypothetical protein